MDLQAIHMKSSISIEAQKAEGKRTGQKKIRKFIEDCDRDHYKDASQDDMNCDVCIFDSSD